MCLICVELIKQRMTIPEAERAARELVVLTPQDLWAKDSLEHTIELLESLEDLDLDKLGKVIEEGAKSD